MTPCISINISTLPTSSKDVRWLVTQKHEVNGDEMENQVTTRSLTFTHQLCTETPAQGLSMHRCTSSD